VEITQQSDAQALWTTDARRAAEPLPGLARSRDDAAGYEAKDGLIHENSPRVGTNGEDEAITRKGEIQAIWVH
jgi:hypothetical protein